MNKYLFLDILMIEKILQKILPYFFIFVFISTCFSALFNYLTHDALSIGGWLTNYQGGMVRRGLLGEMIFRMSVYSGINPGLYVVLIQLGLYAAFLCFSYKLLKKQKNLIPYVFLIFSPALFLFPVYDVTAGFRKEMLYIALLSFFCWKIKGNIQNNIDHSLYGILLIYPFVILSHEMLSVFLPYILATYFLHSAIKKRQLIIIFMLTLLSVVAFMITLNYIGRAEQINPILNSLANQGYPIAEGGAISWIGRDASFGFNIVIEKIKNNYYWFYVVLLIFVLFAYIPIYKRIKLIFASPIPSTLIIASLIGSIALFTVAHDWGRFMYIHLVSIFLISLTVSINESLKMTTQKIHLAALLVFLIYTLSWRLPSCCYPLQGSFNRPNFINVMHPYAKMAIYFFPDLDKKLERWKTKR